MPQTKTEVYLEVGSKRTFACAVDWPGWARSGKDEASALQALLDYGKRYKSAISSARLGFAPPEDARAFKVVERLKGDMTTDFGAGGGIVADSEPLAELAETQAKFQAMLSAIVRP